MLKIKARDILQSTTMCSTNTLCTYYLKTGIQGCCIVALVLDITSTYTKKRGVFHNSHLE